MPTNFPTGIDNLTNPSGSDPQSSPSHAGQHANANDAIEAIEAKVGVDGSAVATSLDYRVDQIEANGLPPTGAAGGSLTGTYPNPTIGAGQVVDATVGASAAIAEGKLALASDAAAATPSRRTLGTGATQAAPGNHNHSGVYQPLDSDLTTIAGLTATTDSFMQSKASAWASRTAVQVAADLAPLLPGYQLGSGTCTTDFSTTSTTRVDVTGLTTGAITVGARPVLIVLNVMVYHSADQGLCAVCIDEDGTNIAQTNISVSGASGFASGTIVISRSPSAGSHTYKGQLFVVAGTGHVYGVSPSASTIRVLNI